MKIKIDVVKEAIMKKTSEVRCTSLFSNRKIEKYGLETLIKKYIADVGDIRMIMDDDLDMIVKNYPISEPIIFE